MMTAPTRRTCPSCQTRLSPLAAECPECGLALAPPRLGRPLLFQASALAHVPMEAPPRALTAPALGRVAAVAVDVAPEELERPGAGSPRPSPRSPPRPPWASRSPSPASGPW